MQRLLTLTLLAVPFVAGAQTDPRRLVLDPALAARGGATCDGGISYDDGSLEVGYGTSSPFTAKAAMEFDVDEGSTLDRVCVCWARDGVDSEITFTISAWSADASGPPKVHLGSFAGAVASGVGTSPGWYSYDVASAGIVLPAESFLGVSWDSGEDQDFFLCADENGPGGQRGYWRTGMQSATAPPTVRLGPGGGAFPNYKALGIRAEVTPGGGIPGCERRATSLTLQNGRFEVSGAAFLRGNPSTFFLQNFCSFTSGVSQTAAAFYFNSGAVPVQEGFVSIRDECPVAWKVEIASASTRRFWVDILDTETLISTRFENPMGGSSSFFPADITAFAMSCP